MEPRLDRRTIKSLSVETGGRGFGAFRAAVLAGCIALVHLVVSPAAWAGTFLDLQTGTGITVTQNNPNLFSSSFGTIDALAINPGAAGVTALPQTNGTLYITTINLFIKGALPNGHRAYVTAYVSANFAHPSAMVMYACPYPSTCTSFAQFSPMSTNSAAPTFMIPQPGITKNTTVPAGIAIWVPDNNGATAFSGTDTVTMHFLAFDFDNGNAQLDDNAFTLNNPNETLQNAVRLTLSTGTGCSVVPAADYTMSFGTMDALAITPATCGGVYAPTTAGVTNSVYWSDYQLLPAFTDQSAFSNSIITAQVTVDFASPSTPHHVFVVRDTANSSAKPASAAGFTALAVTPTPPDTIVGAGSITNRTAITRYIGIGINPTNGFAGLTGLKTATVTFTLTVK